MKKYILVLFFAYIILGCGAEEANEGQTTTISQVSDGSVAVALPDLPMLKSNPINDLERE